VARSADGDPAVPICVLTVASWFPDHDDRVRGRFVADQVEALAATGRVSNAVVTFVPARLTGGARTRSRQEAAITALQESTVRTAADLAGVWRSEGFRTPIVRLTIAEGTTRETGTAHGAIHRRKALDALAARLLIADGPAAEGREGQGRDLRARIGVVHAHTGYPDGAAAVRLAERLGWPLIVTEHASFLSAIWADPLRRAHYATALEAAERLLAVSEMLAGEIRAAFPEHAGKVDVVPNGIPLDLFRGAALADRTPDELLFVGALKASKGIETLIRAVAIARSGRPSIRLRLVGEAPDEATTSRWRRLVDELGLADAVSFDPAGDRRAVAAAMATASVFVHPSPRETFGVVAVEALASGTPVVAIDSGGVTEILGTDPEPVGAIAQTGDAASLADAIRTTLDRRSTFDPEVLRAFAAERFAAATVAGRLIGIYEDATRSTALAAPLAEPCVGSRLGTAGSTGVDAEDVVLVALDRERAARLLASIPAEVRRLVTVLTEAEPAGLDLPVVGRLVSVDVGLSGHLSGSSRGARSDRTPRWRLGRLASDPLGTIGRVIGRDAGSSRSLRPATLELDRVVRQSLAGCAVVPVDGHDHLAVAPLVQAGRARVLPGGWLRLADPPLAAPPTAPQERPG